MLFKNVKYTKTVPPGATVSVKHVLS